ncbi:hypothetical protein WMY93_004644 [Mugilogobius chulae]|uniref:Secreted protein n=1 Tax=Mugilogobius chulae TaxID=88201 RepID=A0AAW0Q0F9_9GOBI
MVLRCVLACLSIIRGAHVFSAALHLCLDPTRKCGPKPGPKVGSGLGWVRARSFPPFLVVASQNVHSMISSHSQTYTWSGEFSLRATDSQLFSDPEKVHVQAISTQVSSH